MGLEQITHEITQHADKEAKKLIDASRQQAKNDIETAHQHADTFETETDIAAQKEVEALEKRYSAGMLLASKKIILQKRKEIIQQLFQEFQTMIRELPKAEKSKILKQLFNNAKQNCSIGTIYCTKQDTPLIKTFFSAVQEKPITGGLIAESKDGKIMLDYSFDTFLQILQERNIQEVHNILFPKKNEEKRES